MDNKDLLSKAQEKFQEEREKEQAMIARALEKEKAKEQEQKALPAGTHPKATLYEHFAADLLLSEDRSKEEIASEGYLGPKNEWEDAIVWKIIADLRGDRTRLLTSEPQQEALTPQQQQALTPQQQQARDREEELTTWVSEQFETWKTTNGYTESNANSSRITSQEASRLNEEHVDYLHRLNTALFEQNDGEQAMEMLAEVARHNGEHMDYLYRQGTALYEQGNYQQVIQVLQDVARRNPSHPRIGFLLADAYYDLGRAYLHLGNSRQAIPAFEASLRLNSNNAQARYRQAYAYGLQGDFARAFASWRRAPRNAV